MDYTLKIQHIRYCRFSVLSRIQWFGSCQHR